MTLERELRRQLKLPWVQHGPGLPEVAIWSSGYKYTARRDVRWEARTSRRPGIGYGAAGVTPYTRNDQAVGRQRTGRSSVEDGRAGGILVVFWDGSAAKDRRAVDRSYLIHVGTVEEVEHIHHQFELRAFLHIDRASQPQVPGLQRITVVRVPRDHRLAIVDRGTGVRSRGA